MTVPHDIVNTDSVACERMAAEVTVSDWSTLLRGAAPDAASALATARLVAGPAHRRAWLGADPEGDRDQALRWLGEATTGLATEQPALAAVLDWWLVAAAGQTATRDAWSIERLLPAPTGDALRRLLDWDGGLTEVRRPGRFRAVIEELRSASERNPGKIAGDKPVLQQANDECKRLLRAAKDGTPPPKDLRLSGLDDAEIEAWANEVPAARRVIPGTPMWETLSRQLRHRAELVRAALAAWPRPGIRTPPPLPGGWETQVTEAVGPDGAELAVSLVRDAVVDPPERALLAPAAARVVLQSLPGAPFPAAIRLAREAWSEDPERRPKWLTAALDRARRLEQSAAGREYVGDAATLLTEARAALAELRLDEAERWLLESETEHSRAAMNAEAARRLARAQELAVQLARVSVGVPGQSTDPEWPDRVTEAYAAARGRIAARVERVRETEFAGSPNLTAMVDDVRAAVQALERGDLPTADEATARAEARTRDLRAKEAELLGPAICALRDRAAALPHPERVSATQVIARLAVRRQAGLSTTEDEAELGQLIDALTKRSAPACITVDLLGRPQRLAWVFCGAVTTGDETRSYHGTRPFGVKVHGVPPSEPVSRVKQWGELAVRPGDAQGDGLIYRWADGHVSGPWRRGLEGVEPVDPSRIVASVNEARFIAAFGAVEIGIGRALVPRPPSLSDLLKVGGKLIDALDDERLASWLSRTLEGAPDTAALALWIAKVGLAGLPEILFDQRLAKLRQLLSAAESLQHYRTEAVTAYLASPPGQQAIDAAAERVVERDTERLRAATEAARAALDAELDAARERAEASLSRIEGDARQAEARVAELREDLQAVEELLADRKLALLARLGGLGAGVRAPEPRPEPAPTTVEPLRAAPFVPTAVPPLPELIRAVAGRTWGEVDVANLLLSMVTGRWTLLAGLPGVGKSTFVRSVLSRLGHGPGTERWLELVVRRDWQDDAALFGFWHPTERTWTASSEGFVEQLLRARHDEERGDGAIWPVLVEELNLASPEYYLARPISAFEASPPELRLYDQALAPNNSGRYPASFRVPDAVRVVATVNVDDTVERLSPRFLSRASVIWVEPSPDAPPWRPEDDLPCAVVRWRDLAALGAAGESSLGRIAEVVRYLQEQRIPGAPTVRTQRAIGRYLGASRGVIPAPDAEDLQILQRVLPPIRGTGPRWRGILDELGALLQRNGWRRSAARTLELRERGEELGDWYDFFHA